MKLESLKRYIYDKVSIYTKADDNWDEFKTLYNGNMADIPNELLSLEVHLIGAKRKGIVDISVIEK